MAWQPRDAVPHLVGGAIRAGMGRLGAGTAIEAFRSQDVVALTYDDGPDGRATEQILHELAGAGARATFFVLLTRVGRYPSLVSELIGEQHEIALHGVDHTNLARLPPWDVRGRLHDGLRQLEDVVGRPVRWYRPPYMALSFAGWAVAAVQSATFVASASSFRDWMPLADADRVRAFASEVRPGDVVLAHDSWPTAEDGADDGPAPLVDRAALTRTMLGVLAAKNLRGVTLAEAAAAGAPVAAPRVSLRGRWC